MADGLLSGGGRRAALDDIGAGLIRYIPPEWRALAGLIAEANPVRGIERAGQAARRLAAPEAAPMERVAATGNVLSEMAGVLAPAAVAGRAGMPAVQAVQEGLLGMSAPARAAGEAVIERLNQPGPMPTLYSNPVPGLMAERRPGIIAYHGSPHTFEPVILIQMPDGTRVYQNLLERRNLPEGAQILEEYPLGRFDMSKIGTGEGAQAYGHGLYFAENEGVARGYRDILSGSMARNANSDRPSDIAFGAMRQFRGDRKAAADWLEQNLQDVDLGNSVPRYEEAISILRSGADIPPPGRLYEVRIDADPEDFLDWDRPLSEQPEVLQKLLRYGGQHRDKIARLKAEREALAAQAPAPSAANDFDALFADDGWDGGRARLAEIDDMIREAEVAAANAEKRGALFSNSLNEDFLASTWGRNLATASSDSYALMGAADDAALAQRLREAGIPGIRYLDRGSRGVGEGTRNYVVFDDRLISIVRMYGIAGAAALLGMSVADVEAALAAQPAQQHAPRGLFGEQ